VELIRPGINIDFIGRRRIGYLVSLILILASLVTLAINRGPNFGIDFIGGTVIQVRFSGPVEMDAIRAGLDSAGLTGVSLQSYGAEQQYEYLVRAEGALDTGDEFSKHLTGALDNATGARTEIRRVEMVGPQVGETLREGALFAMFYSLVFIAIYISGRFEMRWMISAVTAAVLIGGVVLFARLQVSIPLLILAALVLTLVLFWQLRLKYAMGATAALLHDLIITIGIFTLMGREFSLPIVAALLTIIGYSLNDTIIVFDRIRENIRRYGTRELEVNVNSSINETLNRTLLTSSTTLVVLLALLFLGGTIIHDFALTLIIGVIVGTYSSIFVASPMLLLLKGSILSAEEEEGEDEDHDLVRGRTGS
jgi:preprotein translocase subunit SecF